jgi:hypothetical protein
LSVSPTLTVQVICRTDIGRKLQGSPDPLLH